MAETKWHAPSTKVLSSYKDRALQKEGSGKESPNKLSHVSLLLGGNSNSFKTNKQNPNNSTTPPKNPTNQKITLDSRKHML